MDIVWLTDLTGLDDRWSVSATRRDVEVVEVVAVWAKEDGGDEYSLPCADAGTSVAMAAAVAANSE